MKGPSLLFIFLLFVGGNLFSQNSYSNSTHGISLTFPEGWKQQMAWSNNEIQKARYYNVDQEIVTLFTIAVYPSTDAKVNSVNGDGPQKAWDSHKAQFGQDAQDLVDNGSETVNGQPMKWARTSFDLFGKKSFTKTYFFGKNGKIYRFSLQSNGGKEVFEEALGKFEESMKTLKVS